MKLLKELVTTAGTSGREHRMRKLLRAKAKGLFDSIEEDALGSLLCVRKPTKKAKGKSKGKTKADGKSARPTRIMLAAHMDQIGFMIRYIDEKGFARINPVGGFDTRNLFARHVLVCPDVNDPKKDLPGVLNPGGKPIHIATDADRNKVPTIDEFVIDFGLSCDEVKKRVKIGDMVVLRAEPIEVGETIVSQCLDNRVACWIALRAVEQLAKTGHDCEIHCVFTVQEEVGLRGAMTSAFAIQPDIGIAIDTTLCVDTPGVTGDAAVTKQGDGAALTVMDSASIADIDVLEDFERVAVKHKIKHQRSILPRGGTDAGALQRAGVGCRSFTLSCPTRYIHTVTEMVHRGDLNACRDVLAAYLAQV